RAVPRWIAAKPKGLSVRDYYSRLVGNRNYERVLGPMLSAVPSQSADEFPSDMLFKKRERREDRPRSFSVERGLNSVVEGLVAHPNIDVRTDCAAVKVERTSQGFGVEFSDGTSIEAERLALALAPQVVAELLSDSFPEVAAQAARVKQVEVDSLGFATLAENTKLPYATFFIPLCDSFFSAVTRDVIHDDTRRAFTLHFRAGQTKAERLARAQQVTGVPIAQMESLCERRVVLPSPTLGHSEIVRAIDDQLKGEPLAITGNWFSGLAIEDCALRSRCEFERMSALG
ncbi:MAG: oxygen-dependent protoporphyrinogen oxidase, partial [Planctomycetota bacterium]